MQETSSSSPDPLARFARTIDFLGEPGFAALRRATVVVVGLGGVGSHAALALARAGIGRLRLVDFDAVAVSNLNRHAVATLADAGQPKADVMVRRLADIVPDTEATAVRAFFHRDKADEILAGPLDFVVDAIDGLNTKVTLLRCCVERGLAVVSSMGASARSDPSLVRVGPIESSSGCPLARHVRRRLRRQGVATGITVVYSTEASRTPLPPDDEESQLGPGRTRNRLPSLPTLPGIFGFAAANEVIARLAGLARGE